MQLTVVPTRRYSHGENPDMRQVPHHVPPERFHTLRHDGRQEGASTSHPDADFDNASLQSTLDTRFPTTRNKPSDRCWSVDVTANKRNTLTGGSLPPLSPGLATQCKRTPDSHVKESKKVRRKRQCLYAQRLEYFLKKKKQQQHQEHHHVLSRVSDESSMHSRDESFSAFSHDDSTAWACSASGHDEPSHQSEQRRSLYAQRLEFFLKKMQQKEHHHVLSARGNDEVSALTQDDSSASSHDEQSQTGHDEPNTDTHGIVANLPMQSVCGRPDSSSRNSKERHVHEMKESDLTFVQATEALDHALEATESLNLSFASLNSLDVEELKELEKTISDGSTALQTLIKRVQSAQQKQLQSTPVSPNNPCENEIHDPSSNPLKYEEPEKLAQHPGETNLLLQSGQMMNQSVKQKGMEKSLSGLEPIASKEQHTTLTSTPGVLQSGYPTKQTMQKIDAENPEFGKGPDVLMDKIMNKKLGEVASNYAKPGASGPSGGSLIIQTIHSTTEATSQSATPETTSKNYQGTEAGPINLKELKAPGHWLGSSNGPGDKGWVTIEEKFAPQQVTHTQKSESTQEKSCADVPTPLPSSGLQTFPNLPCVSEMPQEFSTAKEEGLSSEGNRLCTSPVSVALLSDTQEACAAGTNGSSFHEAQQSVPSNRDAVLNMVGSLEAAEKALEAVPEDSRRAVLEAPASHIKESVECLQVDDEPTSALVVKSDGLHPRASKLDPEGLIIGIAPSEPFDFQSLEKCATSKGPTTMMGDPNMKETHAPRLQKQDPPALVCFSEATKKLQQVEPKEHEDDQDKPHGSNASKPEEQIEPHLEGCKLLSSPSAHQASSRSFCMPTKSKVRKRGSRRLSTSRTSRLERKQPKMGATCLEEFSRTFTSARKASLY